MAIQKTKTLANGATGNYWKIVSAEVNVLNLVATWTFALFCDKAHADNVPNDPISGGKLLQRGITKEQKKTDLFALGYAAAKTSDDPDFAGGVDA